MNDINTENLENVKIIYVNNPENKLQTTDFKLEKSKVPSLNKESVLVETLLLSIDAANRAWMQGRTYRDKIMPGQIMSGYAIGKVLHSKNKNFSKGDFVEGDLGWQKYSIAEENEIAKFDATKDLQLHMSILGISGKTAYFGLELADLKQGETLLVSAAAGSVGSIVGQIAKIKGCTVIGITGSDEKLRWLEEDLGFDLAVNYNEKNYIKKILAFCPGKIDVFFDNVGGNIFESSLFTLKNYARVVCCGAVSQYDTSIPQTGPRNVPGLIVTKRLTLKGFIVTDFESRRNEVQEQLMKWYREKKLVSKVYTFNGLENAPQALVNLLNGHNMGKTFITL